MEPEGMIHDHSKPGKPSPSEVAQLKETISTGMRILDDAASREGDTSGPRISGETAEALDIICKRALSGDREAFTNLNKLARDVVSNAGSLGTSGRSGNVRPESHKSRRGAGRKRRAPVCKVEEQLPDHPLSAVDLPESLPDISLHEIGDFIQARNTFLLARADYERRRAELIYKLRMLCIPEDRSNTADYVLQLDGDGDTLIITDQTSIPVETIVDRR